MKYENIKKAVFESRPNRFVARVNLNGESLVAHVKNTGRCRELLPHGAEVFLDEPQGRERKTKYDLVAVKKRCDDGRELMINMDSSAPNTAVKEFLFARKLFSDSISIHPEFTVGESRLDFRVETPNSICYIEAKGVTLEEGKIAYFPDAPTERGIKHIRELIRLKKEGFDAVIFFVIQMDECRYFTPNIATHPQFATALKAAAEQGVNIIALNCHVEPDSLVIKDYVEVKL
jgi:sugar fermentation stimulation protein A